MRKISFCSLIGLLISQPVYADVSPIEISGSASLEFRYFPQDALSSEQSDSNFSFAIQPEFYQSWNGGKNSLLFTPFLRLDEHDSERTHADIRELLYETVSDNWELRAGIGKVFWGTTESQHLVDIINQTDLIENSDTEDKLGQPLINLALIRPIGTLDLFILPGFRERTFAGGDGRLRFIPAVDTGNPIYESSAEDKHVDWAVRWSQTLADWDIGISHFSGTSREPLFIANNDGSALIPVYNLIDQTGLDIQTYQGNWLLKLEAISRSGQGRRFSALITGFEYTFVGVFNSVIDVGWIAEYLFDDRKNNALTPFEDDYLIGTRITLNDAQSSEFLFGIIQDASSNSQSFNLEASHRIGQSWKIELESRWFSNINPNDIDFSFSRDDYIQFTLSKFF
ncbi:MAG: hypothetical protein GXP21_08215 [Gammaproteobacteria bacterium]|nr:hypothetical protein [Gammaproteobacteria bacterium]